MDGRRIHRTWRWRLPYLASAIVVAGWLVLDMPAAHGIDLPLRSLTLSSSLASAQATYLLTFTVPSPETLGAIKVQFCANDPLLSDPCEAPAGLDASAAVLSSQSGATGFTIDTGSSNANTLVLTRVPSGIASPVPSAYTFQNITNPSAAGSYYARVQTFPGTDTNAPENEHGGLAFSIDSAVQISTTVPPYLLFCSGVVISGFDCAAASGDYINLGNFAPTAASVAGSQLLTATNAPDGFTISIYGSTMTSGNNIIAALAARDVSRPGVGQFGLNLAANQNPAVGAAPAGSGSAAATSAYNQANFFKFQSGDVLASASSSDAYRKFTVSYIVNIPRGQTPGIYAATLTYVCLANF